MFARSDDGGVSRAANWSAYDLPDPYCEGSLLSDLKAGTLLFGNPSHAGHRLNFSVHRSATAVARGRARQGLRGRRGLLGHGVHPQRQRRRALERGFGGDPYKWVSFGVLPVPQ